MTTCNDSFFAQLGAVQPTECGDPACTRLEGEEYHHCIGQAGEGLAPGRLPVPLYVIAAAALLG